HETKVANTGAEAIEAVRAFDPEFLLLDIGLPGMNGYEVAAQIRSDTSANDLIIIAVTGYGQAADICRSRETGFDYHLVKHIFLDALLRLLSGPRTEAESVGHLHNHTAKIDNP